MKYVISIIGGYCLGWFIFYAFFIGEDFNYFFEYLRLAWTNPGEIPTFINIGAISFSAIFTLSVWWYSQKQKTK
jgi:hypothetical protein